MQFKGFHINNLKSYRKYFCFPDAAEALENGAYQAWLTSISELPEYGETAAGEDAGIIGEIRRLLDQLFGRENPGQQSETENQLDGRSDEKLYRRLFLLFFALARMPVTEEDREQIYRAARTAAEKQTGSIKGENKKTDLDAEISVTGENYEIQVWKNKIRREEMPKENRSLFRWKKLINAGTVPISVRLMDGDRTEASRRLDPGGDVWILTLNGCFAKWGSRVQVDHRSFACVDRKGCLTVNGYPMQGAGMVDFSFDQRTGILGVDGSGRLRQYSSLELETKDEDGAGAGRKAGDRLMFDGTGKEKFVFAGLYGRRYILVKESGALITNVPDLTDGPADLFSRQAAEEEKMISAGAAALPFPAFMVSVSEQLIGFETPDGRVGVWERERKQLLWMEV